MVVRLPLASIFQYDQSGRRRGEVAMSMAAPGNVFHQPHIPGTKICFVPSPNPISTSPQR